MSLCINPGHGNNDPGATSNGIKEKDLNLAFSLYQAKRFEKFGVDVALTRKDDSTGDKLNQVCKDISNSKAKVCISNHNNATGDPAVNGCEVIHSIHSSGKLANLIFQNLVSTGLIKGRRVFCRESEKNPGNDYYAVHKQTGSIETVIIEYGFLTNEHDRKVIDTENQKILSEAVIKAVCQYTGALYSPPEESKKDSEEWKKKDIEELAIAGIISDPNYWKERVNDNMPVWAVMTLINRVRKG